MSLSLSSSQRTPGGEGGGGKRGREGGRGKQIFKVPIHVYSHYC